MNNKNKKGKVILAGAGPGDPELITMKTVRYLRQADVVLVDRLVSEEILKKYVNTKAEILYVGKQGGNYYASTPQETINELIVEYALQGNLVVRLKGGDVSIFSNMLDELEALTANNISYEIVPGISAASGAAAYAAIPLTARNYSSSVRFLTYYKSDIISEEYWEELANTSDTLVFYMSAERLDEIVEKLTANNIDKEKSLAVIEQATTPMQKIYIANLYEYEEELKGQSFISPSLIIVGKVVALHEQFAWFTNSHNNEYYFKSIEEVIEYADRKQT